MSTNILQSLSDNIAIDTDKCNFCGICADTCIPDNLRMKLAPCRAACPLEVNCQGYVRLRPPAARTPWPRHAVALMWPPESHMY